jgi:hypothetical protein
VSFGDFATIRGTMAVAAILGMVACNDVLGPGPEVDLTVTVSQDVAVPGENVTITIAVFNPADHDVSLGEECPPLGFRVVDEKGRRVGPSFGWERTFVCIGEIDNRVPAGETREFGFLWSPYRTYGASGVPLPAGEYRIFAGFAGEPLRPPFSERVPIRVGAP